MALNKDSSMPGAGKSGSLRAGVAKSDITTNAKGAAIHDPLYAKALVVDDGRTQVAIIAMDTTAIGGRRISQRILDDVGDETRIYYLGSDVGNADATWYRSGIAYIQRDRYAYRALRVNRDYKEPKDRLGTITLAAARLPAKPRIAVNVSQATEQRTVRCEIRDAEGTLIPGFSFEDCRPVTRDGIRQAVAWKNADIAALAGKNVRIGLRIHSPDCQFGDQDSPRIYAAYTS